MTYIKCHILNATPCTAKINGDAGISAEKMSYMYKVVRIERFIDTVFRDEFKFNKREAAEQAYEQECKRPEAVDVRLYYCFPYQDDHEIACFTRRKKKEESSL